MLGVGLPELPTQWHRRPLWIGCPPRRGSPSHGWLRPVRRGPEAPSPCRWLARPVGIHPCPVPPVNPEDWEEIPLEPGDYCPTAFHLAKPAEHQSRRLRRPLRGSQLGWMVWAGSTTIMDSPQASQIAGSSPGGCRPAIPPLEPAQPSAHDSVYRQCRSAAPYAPSPTSETSTHTRLQNHRCRPSARSNAEYQRQSKILVSRADGPPAASTSLTNQTLASGQHVRDQTGGQAPSRSEDRAVR